MTSCSRRRHAGRRGHRDRLLAFLGVGATRFGAEVMLDLLAGTPS
ncbi:hypothetical protein ACFQ2M_07585 [Kitasatospora saccharophila]